MEITEVRIKLMEATEDRLRGFCSITFDDCFVVRDLKIIEGNNGPFVAMPSRKLTKHCHKCRTKNHLRARFCNQCGARIRNEEGIEYDEGGRAKLYADVAHPVNAECREMIQSRVIEELEKEVQRSKEPGYASRYDDDYDIIQRHSKNQEKRRVDDSHANVQGKSRRRPPEQQTQKTSTDGGSETTQEKEADHPGKGGFGEGIFD